MKTFTRILLVFLGLLFIGGALFLLVVNYDLLPGLQVELPAWADENVMLVVGAALLLIALILLALGFRSSKKKVGTAVLKGSEYGEVLISITAVENMVLRVVQQTRGIKDAGRNVVFTPDGLVIRIRITVMPDLALPDLINDLQSRTKEYIEEITGVTVSEVKIIVENVNMDQAASKK